MIRILLITSLIALVGCNQNTKLKGPPPVCNDGRQSVLDVDTDHGKIILCGTPLPKSHAMMDGSVLMSDFLVFQVGEKNERSIVTSFSEKDEMLKASKDGERVRVARLIDLGGEMEPYEQFFIECDKKGCKRTAGECTLTKKKEGFPLAIKQIEPFLKGHDFSYVKGHLVNQIAYEAHFGSKDAADFMANAHKKIPESSAWKGAFSSGQFFVQKLAELGCK